MQDHRTAGLGERSCSGEPPQLPPPCATAPKRHYQQRGWKRGAPGSEGKHHKLGPWGRGWVARERGRGFLTGTLPLAAGLGPEGSPGAQLANSTGSCSTHWKSLCEAWRPIQRSKVTLGRLAVMNATVPRREL